MSFSKWISDLIQQTNNALSHLKHDIKCRPCTLQSMVSELKVWSSGDHAIYDQHQCDIYACVE